MKWTTANVKNPNYTHNHEIYVGTQTGSFKRLIPANEDNPFAQNNLYELNKLDKDSRITSLSFGNADKSEILIGRANNVVELHSLRTEQIVRSITMPHVAAMGVARYDKQLVGSFANGSLHSVSFDTEMDDDEAEPQEVFSTTSGDDVAHMRQCAVEPKLIATGGKGRHNNLKVFDLAAGGKQVFTSKNLPNDYLQLEVPVWDSDVGFIDSPFTLATCSRHGYVRVYDTRKQRRPVQCYAAEKQMSFATLTAKGNYIYTGTTMGALKAFDIRRLKNFVHTYKGFTGSISDVQLDDGGKHLVSASLDRYVRVHDVDSCVLLYQCYVKSKASRVLVRESREIFNQSADEENEKDSKNSKKLRKNGKAAEEDAEYEDLFENMQTICENDEATEDVDDSAATPQSGLKRKGSGKSAKSKKSKK